MQVVCVGICSFHVSGGCAAFRRTPTFSPKAERSARPVTQSKSRSKDAYSLLTIRQSPAPRSVCARASSSGDPTAEVASQPEQQAAEADAINQEQAWQLLQEFTRLNARGLDQSMLDSHAKRARLRAATLVRIQFHWCPCLQRCARRCRVCSVDVCNDHISLRSRVPEAGRGGSYAQSPFLRVSS